MITALYSFIILGNIRGLELWVLFWIMSVVLYFVSFTLFKCNRSKTGLKNMLILMLTAEVIFDLIWLVIFYFNKVYVEYAVGITYGLFMWIAFLIVAGIVATVINHRKVSNKK